MLNIYNAISYKYHHKYLLKFEQILKIYIDVKRDQDALVYNNKEKLDEADIKLNKIYDVDLFKTWVENAEPLNEERNKAIRKMRAVLIKSQISYLGLVMSKLQIGLSYYETFDYKKKIMEKILKYLNDPLNISFKIDFERRINKDLLDKYCEKFSIDLKIKLFDLKQKYRGRETENNVKIIRV